MSDLRQAAEMALEFVEWLCGDDHSVRPKNKALDVRKALRQALAQPGQEPYASQAAMVAHIADRIRIDPETGNVSIGTPAQALDLQTAIEKGTKAWADVPNASQWVEELRGNDKPPVKSYCGGKPNYCTPVDGVYMSEERVHKTDKSMHEPVAMRYDFDGYGYKYIDSGSGSNWQTRIKDAEPLYAAPPQREWVGLTGKEIAECIQMGEGGFVKLLATYRAIEAKLKEKNT